ncbi:SidA/IucD/PvdA family monooxygenase [Rubrobacter marinus]|uniref:SidA/IucD/PvdA family monooxygenase n=1 Tax=Rubrobacter marinus TaxID=2653852 RepID=A0A6G8PTE6_9ACTN|nr:SidA/IucD/PvdA family monooxygenase [Rubrobacter marinus]
MLRQETSGETQGVSDVTDVERMAVIGAGAAGLCAAKHLLERGFAVTVFEMGSQVGGLWVYENDNARSPAYLSLRINSEPRATQFHDFPFPEDYPFNPTHFQVHAYLEAYADHFDIRRHIRFNAKVASVEQPTTAPGNEWRIRLADGTEESFDGVVIATGHQGVPSHPPFAKKFGGEYLHSHDYRTPEPFRDKRVLVVGTGNSALDIAADICTVTASTTMTARSPVLIMPRMLFGVPIQRTIAKISKPGVPWAVERRFRELLTYVAHGRVEDWGFVRPKKRTHPASHPTIMGHIAWRRIAVKTAGADDADGNEVHFSDGTVERFDTVIAATGYEIDLPFLSEEMVPVTGRRLDLYKRVAAPGWPGLYFVGFHNVSGGANIRIMDVQADLVAALAKGDVGLPDRSEMIADIERERRRIERRYPDSPRYGLELDPPVYTRDVEEELHPHRSRLRLRRTARYFLRDAANAVYHGRRGSTVDRRLMAKLAATGLAAVGVATIVALPRARRRS